MELVMKSKTRKKEIKTWSQEKRVGDKEERVSVEKLDGEGFLVTTYRSWYDDKGEWKTNSSKQYSEENPLAEDTSTPIDQIFDKIKNNKIIS